MWIERQLFAIIVEHSKKSLLKNNHQISSIKIDVLMDSFHTTFHYKDMTFDVAFISSVILSLRSASLPDVSVTFCFSSSPIARNNQLTDWVSKLAKKCYRIHHYVLKMCLQPTTDVFTKWHPILSFILFVVQSDY